MAIKFAEDIIKEVKKRGTIEVPDDCVTGEEFEKWLCTGNAYSDVTFNEHETYDLYDIDIHCQEYIFEKYIKEYIDLSLKYVMNCNIIDDQEVKAKANYGNENYSEAA